MRYFGLGIVAFIFVQTICAILLPSIPCTCTNKCEKDLAHLRSEAAKFFTEFGNEHNIAHQDLEVIQNNSDMLGMSLDAFASVNYGTDFDLDILQCILKQFVDIVAVKRVETGKSIAHLQGECRKLLDMADDFRFNNFLICKSSCVTQTLSGCDAKLNKLRCELLDFFKVLKKAAGQADKQLRVIDRSCSSIGKVEKKFRAAYTLTCDQDENAQPEENTNGNIYNLKVDIRSYYNETRRPYDIGRVQLDNLTLVCGNLSAAITSWTGKLAA